MNTKQTPEHLERTGLGGHVTSGLMWMLLSTFVAKGGSFAAQIVLGWLLLKEDFGIYAIALGVTSLVQVLKDGGTRKIIIQKGVRRFDRLCPAVFWMASGFNAVTALVLLAAAVPIAQLYEEPQLVPMLIVLAGATLVGTPDTMYRAWLSVQLRFKDLAKIQTMLGLIRSISMILFAVSGAGVMSFAWPALIMVLSGWILGRWMCGSLPIWGAIRLRLWPILLYSSAWMFVGSAALMMLRQGPYMILGLYHDPALVGVYFFAFQLLLQINQVIALNFQSVLLPSLSAIGHHVQRHANAVVRASGSLTLVGTLIAMGVCVGIGDMIRLLWGEKWVDAIPAVQWMGLFFPFRMLQSIFEPTLISRGLYRKWALLVVVQAVVVLVATIIATTHFSSAGGFAMVIGIGFVVSMLLAGSLGMRMVGVSFSRMAKAVLPVWAIGGMLFAGILLLRQRIGWNTSAPPPELIARGLISSTAFILGYTATLRILNPGALELVLNTIPKRFSTKARRALLLKSREQL